jgi:DNA-binding HxlR family transcriptional regulator
VSISPETSVVGPYPRADAAALSRPSPSTYTAGAVAERLQARGAASAEGGTRLADRSGRRIEDVAADKQRPARVAVNRGRLERPLRLASASSKRARSASPEIRDAVAITPKVLTQTLRALERDGLVVRRAYAEIPPRVEYELTPLGLTLREPLGAIRAWAETHIHGIIAARERRDGGNDQ